jgi:hypothetical protein
MESTWAQLSYQSLKTKKYIENEQLNMNVWHLGL